VFYGVHQGKPKSAETQALQLK